jgi:hypothetical protein
MYSSLSLLSIFACTHTNLLPVTKFFSSFLFFKDYTKKLNDEAANSDELLHWGFILYRNANAINISSESQKLRQVNTTLLHHHLLSFNRFSQFVC